MNNSMTYWLALHMMRTLPTRRKNEIYVACFNAGRSIVDLFEDPTLQQSLMLTDVEKQQFDNAKAELPNYAFLVEELLNQGYHIIPIDSKDYPPTLKRNLKVYAPSVLFTKGNIKLLSEPSVAIVGSRNASPIALDFASQVAVRAALQGKVVVSGGAKGVDQTALNSAIANGGKGIIVIPQGITTYTAGYREYYKPILEGRVVVISEFGPKAGWNVGLAMARNNTIYAMADRIFVAESDNKGGTWEGVIAGLKRNRSIYVRESSTAEQNANNLLIAMGAIPYKVTESKNSIQSENSTEAFVGYDRVNPLANLTMRIQQLLSSGSFTAAQIRELLNAPLPEPQMRQLLDLLDFVEKFKQKNKNFYRLKGTQQDNLFSL